MATVSGLVGEHVGSGGASGGSLELVVFVVVQWRARRGRWSWWRWQLGRLELGVIGRIEQQLGLGGS